MSIDESLLTRISSQENDTEELSLTDHEEVIPFIPKQRSRESSEPLREYKNVRLGDILLSKGLISEEELKKALKIQRSTKSLLGSIFISSGIVKRVEVYEALSESWGVPFIDTTSAVIDSKLLKGEDPKKIIARQWIPLFKDSDGFIVIGSSRYPDDVLRKEVEEKLGSRVKIFVTTDWDISHTVLKEFQNYLLDEAAFGLWKVDSDKSAKTVLTAQQKAIAAVIFLSTLLILISYPKPFLIFVSMLVNFCFLFSIAFKFVISIKGAQLLRKKKKNSLIAQKVDERISDSDLPVYTILAPVYKEANVIGKLIENLYNLDYPKEKLDIIILLEEDDVETWEAAKAMNPPGNVNLIKIPSSQPKTKPKACNIGLFLAKGDYLVIYDAEDKPEKDQLRKAIEEFLKGPDNLVCVQAALNYFNSNENALTRLFTTEYSFWFDYMLPGLEGMGLPIPLGGTSNHFKVEMLRKLGGWDPFNVTEDADLGARASAMGYKVGVIDSTTFEEANNRYGNFIRQRSRWIKGYMQTVLVHSRHPVKLWKTIGAKSIAGFLLLIAGTPLAFLATLPMYVLFVLSLFYSDGFISMLYPPIVQLIGAINLFVGTSLMVALSMLAPYRRKNYKLIPWGLLNPVYWLLHTVAAYKALWQLVFKPHYWEKTLHGLTNHEF